MDIPRSLSGLLTGLVDYAGLFPPSQLDMASTVGNYAAYRQDRYAWALGRLIVPAPRFAEFVTAFEALDHAPAQPWPISVLVGDTASDFPRLPLSDPRFRIDTAELKASTPAAIHMALEHLPPGVTPYFELPLAGDLPDLVTTLAATGARAKVRTGGITPDLFPTPAELLRFMRTCFAAGVPFKATAGLHHPLRAAYRLTYAPDSAAAPMFGFVNVFLTAAALLAGATEAQAAALLVESNPHSLEWSAAGVRWRDLLIESATLEQARAHSAIAFGSCSFIEPIEDLQTLSLL
ncbi:MAG: hypothetical protein H0T53_06315 [Herpetosiphonaceae bacterium]|nr:hypothetical protein [Herpetosiphonaceae bacterium]